jgi:hypothetical protein
MVQPEQMNAGISCSKELAARIGQPKQRQDQHGNQSAVRNGRNPLIPFLFSIIQDL